MSTTQLRTVAFEDKTHIRVRFQLGKMAKRRMGEILIATFAGSYKPGGAGRVDAAYICGMIETAVGFWDPRGLIVDIQQLEYVWGDEMAWVVGLASKKIPPTAIVGSELCLPAIATLYHGLKTTIRATEMEGVFDNLEAGWHYVYQKLEAERALRIQKWWDLRRGRTPKS